MNFKRAEGVIRGGGTGMENLRRIEKVLKSIPTIEGAGVRLNYGLSGESPSARIR